MNIKVMDREMVIELKGRLNDVPEGTAICQENAPYLYSLAMLDRRFACGVRGTLIRMTTEQFRSKQRRELEYRWELLHTEPDTLQFLFYPAEIRSMSECLR